MTKTRNRACSEDMNNPKADILNAFDKNTAKYVTRHGASAICDVDNLVHLSLFLNRRI